LIFRIILLQWTLTVVSVMPISLAICLISRPSTTWLKIARSQGREFLESRSERLQDHFILAARTVSCESDADRLSKPLGRPPTLYSLPADILVHKYIGYTVVGWG
jgi:hypothetical protein